MEKLITDKAKKLAYNLMIAQEYSNAAKEFKSKSYYFHYREIELIINSNKNMRLARKELYSNKSLYLLKAIDCTEKEQVFYDKNENCLYFELPYGQCSFHYFMDYEHCEKFSNNVIVVEKYKWLGKNNTEYILRNFINQNEINFYVNERIELDYIIASAKKSNIELNEIEVYSGDYYFVDSLNEDSEFIESGFNSIKDDRDVIDWSIISAQEYSQMFKIEEECLDSEQFLIVIKKDLII